MNLMPMIMGMQGTIAAHRGANLMFGAMDAQMSLANQVTGNESMQDVVRFGQMDKALALQGAYAQTLYLAGQAMQESAQNLKKRNEELDQRLRQNGAVFV